MHPKRTIKKNEANYPVKKSIRVVKAATAARNEREQRQMLACEK